MKKFTTIALSAVVAMFGATSAMADSETVDVEITVAEFCELSFTSSSTIAMELNEAGDTDVGTANLALTGNTEMTVTLEADDPRGVGQQAWATHSNGSDQVGYSASLEIDGVGNEQIDNAGLASHGAVPVSNARAVNVHAWTDVNWTDSGDPAAPGTYSGEMTVTCSNN
jgi:spore coat protein U-like protein